MLVKMISNAASPMHRPALAGQVVDLLEKIARDFVAGGFAAPAPDGKGPADKEMQAPPPMPDHPSIAKAKAKAEA